VMGRFHYATMTKDAESSVGVVRTWHVALVPTGQPDGFTQLHHKFARLSTAIILQFVRRTAWATLTLFSSQPGRSHGLYRALVWGFSGRWRWGFRGMPSAEPGDSHLPRVIPRQASIRVLPTDCPNGASAQTLMTSSDCRLRNSVDCTMVRSDAPCQSRLGAMVAPESILNPGIRIWHGRSVSDADQIQKLRVHQRIRRTIRRSRRTFKRYK
jgi:hypothetical protein